MDSSDNLEKLMSKPVVTIESSEPVKKALRIMIDKDIGNVCGCREREASRNID